MSQETEMWVIEGRQPVLWTIPVFVKWNNDDEGEMFYAVSYLLQKQLGALTERLKDHARPFNGMWIISRHALKRIARLTPGGDPECYFSWHLSREGDQPKYKPETRVERDEFLDSLFQSGATGLDRATLEFVWRQFCLHMGNWLINREKSIDFYFFTIHPMPYRSNWKDRMLDEFTRRFAAHAMSRQATELKQIDVREMLLDPSLLAMNESYGICYRRLEVEHKKAWWKNVIRSERYKLSKLGPHEYAFDFTGFCIRCIERSKRLFFSFLSENNRPAPVDVPGDVAGTFRLVSPRATGQVHNSLLGYHPSAAAIADKVEETCVEKALPSTNGSVPEVRPVQPETQDVRDADGHVHEPENTAG